MWRWGHIMYNVMYIVQYIVQCKCHVLLLHGGQKIPTLCPGSIEKYLKLGAAVLYFADYSSLVKHLSLLKKYMD